MRIALTRDAEEFTRLAGGMLEQRIERNLLATVLSNILQGGYSDAQPLFARGIDDDGQTRFAAMRTPPWPMLATELEPEAAPDLIAAWLEVDPELPGVGGVPTDLAGDRGRPGAPRPAVTRPARCARRCTCSRRSRIRPGRRAGGCGSRSPPTAGC